eukprot:4886187-Pleurochrysis_carterae.AAC.2
MSVGSCYFPVLTCLWHIDFRPWLAVLSVLSAKSLSSTGFGYFLFGEPDISVLKLVSKLRFRSVVPDLSAQHQVSIMPS